MNSIIRTMAVQVPRILPMSQLFVRNIVTPNPTADVPRVAFYDKTLIFDTYGNPVDVLHMETPKKSHLKENEVCVSWLLAPVNPADINIIQGQYPIKPMLPAVPGNEGVGIVTSIGARVNSLQIGDRVIPNCSNIGTWSTKGIYKANLVQKVPSDLGLVEASMLHVNPCTAYRMLKDFVKLNEGDTVIQNGGNSAVGQMVIQLCKLWGYTSVSIIRDRPNVLELKAYLRNLGANHVLLDTELKNTDLFTKNNIPKPKLALNCVSGINALHMAKFLEHSGTMVTYGAMARQPLTLPVSLLIFKDLTFKGFWMTRWTDTCTRTSTRKTMLEELSKMFIDGKLQVPPHKLVPFKEYKEAVTNALSEEGRKELKYILNLQDK